MNTRDDNDCDKCFAIAAGNLTVFWGSLLGFLCGCLLSSMPAVFGWEFSGTVVSPWPLALCSIGICVHFFLGIVFLNYDPVISPVLKDLSTRGKRSVFFSQVFLILGCSLVVAFLSMGMPKFASLILVVQTAFALKMWPHIWRVYFHQGSEKRSSKGMIFFSDAVIFVIALYFASTIWFFEGGSEVAAGGFVMIVAFLVCAEVATNHSPTLIGFVEATVRFLKDGGFDPPGKS